ncbi:MAG TPA: GIY-YIG nuclease family protein [Candidatus Paceibacterota bacterium]|nr:GIY-YIG nuclease family protein [Candidatus Paceibacterota bacterium]
MKGRTVKIYLVDGIPSGVMTAEIMNWTGKFTVAPRTQLADLAQRDELKRTGVYILAGQNPKDPSQEMVYIGESDNIWKRLIQHNSDSSKDFWGKTIIITSKDENLTKAHGRYLESRLIQIASQAQRAQVINGTNPEITSLPEPDIADMEYFLAQIQMILPVLGFTFAVPLPKINIVQNSESPDSVSPVFHFNYAGSNAEAQEVNGEFIVFEGSTARKAHTNSLAESYIQIREKLQREGKLVDSQNPDYWVFAQNVPFQSPSTAANIVGGASLNGRQHWKVKDTGESYAQWQDEQIKKAETVESVQNASES